MGKFDVQYSFADGKKFTKVIEAETPEEALDIGTASEHIVLTGSGDKLHSFSRAAVLYTTVSKHTSAGASSRSAW